MKEYSVDRELDELDKAILRELQMDSRMSNVEVANRVNLSPPAVHARIRRLEQLGYIRQYVTLWTGKNSATTCCASSVSRSNSTNPTKCRIFATRFCRCL